MNKLLIIGILVLFTLSCANAQDKTALPPSHIPQKLGYRSVPILHVGDLQFKDLDRNGKLDPYEDWRLPATVRAADLISRMSLNELAGVMVHGDLPALGKLGSIGWGTEYDLVKAKQMIADRHINAFITRLHISASDFAAQNNRIQEIAESTPLGIPVTISSDPRNHFEQVLGASDKDESFSLWPEPLGLAAINDPELMRRFGDVVRQEYMAVGIRQSLAPQADLATEPRWARINGTFGEDPEIAKRMVEAYVSGLQNGTQGLNSNSVIAVVKHFVGYGAVENGWDSHNYYGRFAHLTDESLALHLAPFTGAFASHVAAVMPTYPILQGVSINGTPLEPVGAGFSRQLLTELLRERYHFDGVVLSDWAITNDCSARCREGSPIGDEPQVGDIAMPWGVEKLTKVERFAKAINAGVDQIGGTEEPEVIVDAVKRGLVSESRVREAAARILVQKFAIGLFEQPYVDEAAAARIVGNSIFIDEGQKAQARAVVLLENNTNSRTGKPILPIAGANTKLYLYGIDSRVAESYGFTIVKNPSEADLAIVRGPAPYESEHKNYFFGSRQHEGRLFFSEHDEAYRELLKASQVVPTVFITMLERPLLLSGVRPHVAALLGDFGIEDRPLFELLVGKETPQGHLPFELPSSQRAIEQQRSDLPHDSKDPLYPFGYGLHF